MYLQSINPYIVLVIISLYSLIIIISALARLIFLSSFHSTTLSGITVNCVHCYFSEAICWNARIGNGYFVIEEMKRKLVPGKDDNQITVRNTNLIEV